jgi:hypothetical protein
MKTEKTDEDRRRSGNSMIALIRNGGGRARSKYMEVHQESLKERVTTRELEIDYVKTDGMVADILMKSLGG